MHYYKRNIGDYHKKAGRLSMLEHGSYTLLIDSCYDRERFPTEAEAIEWCWARTADEIAAVRFVLSRFFEFDGTIYVQERIREEIEAYREKSVKNKEIAENREKARREKRNVSSTKRAHDVHEAPPNQEPITNNQEPKNQEEKQDQDQEPLPADRGPKSKRKSRLPDEFIVTGDMRKWAAESAPLVNLRLETESFCDYWRGKGETKADWVATWRNWMRKAQGDAERGGRRGGFNGGQFLSKAERIEQANNAVLEEIRAEEIAKGHIPGGVISDAPAFAPDADFIEGDFFHAT